MSIADNVKRVYESISEAALRAGRRPEEITLVAASKMNSAERVREAFDGGIRVFGENRVQEMTEKNTLGAYEGAELHFIGHLQKNKVKNVVGVCRLIHSVDSEELARECARRAQTMGITQEILLEVNIGGEASKSGVEPARLDGLAAYCSSLGGAVKVAGLMAIPPFDASIEETRRYFEQMYQLFVDMRSKKYDNVSMHALSMGMSGDYAEAILAGANIVRVGTFIFGERHYS